MMRSKCIANAYQMSTVYTWYAFGSHLVTHLGTHLVHSMRTRNSCTCQMRNNYMLRIRHTQSSLLMCFVAFFFTAFGTSNELGGNSKSMRSIELMMESNDWLLGGVNVQA